MAAKICKQNHKFSAKYALISEKNEERAIDAHKMKIDRKKETPKFQKIHKLHVPSTFIH